MGIKNILDPIDEKAFADSLATHARALLDHVLANWQVRVTIKENSIVIAGEPKGTQ